MKSSRIFLLAASLLVASCGRKTEETQVSRRDITELVFATGTLKPVHEYRLTAQTEGYITSFPIEEGDLVALDQPLATIENKTNQVSSSGNLALLDIAERNAMPEAPAFKQLDASIKAAEEKLTFDEAQMKRFEKLITAQSISQVEYENARVSLAASRANLESLKQQREAAARAAAQQWALQKMQSEISKTSDAFSTIRALAPGKVYRKMKEQGDYVRRGDIIAVVGSADSLYAHLQVDENNIARLKPGQIADIRLNVDKEITYRAELREILPAFDETTQSYFIEAAFTDSLTFRISGTQLEANIVTGTKKNVLVIPRHYLRYGNKVKVKRDKTEEVPVQPGFISNEWVEIISGLNENETIITEAVK